MKRLKESIEQAVRDVRSMEQQMSMSSTKEVVMKTIRYEHWWLAVNSHDMLLETLRVDVKNIIRELFKEASKKGGAADWGIINDGLLKIDKVISQAE
jgi:hypothetical protein